MSDLIAQGKYQGRAKEWKLGETSTGKEQVAVEFEFRAGEQVHNLLWFGFFTDAALETTLKALRACGWKGTDVLELDTPQADLSANEVTLVVEHEVYEGVTRARIRWVNGSSGVGVVNALPAEKRANFAQRMKASILAAEQGKPKASPPTPAPGAAKPAASGDIPF